MASEARPPPPAPAVENWDDEFDIDAQGSPAHNFAYAVSTVKTSLSSRRSTRSESNPGDDDWNINMDPTDNSSAHAAITSAKQAGIPLPSNVPSSALLGGAIKRLGTSNIRKHTNDVSADWAEDLELPSDASAPLQLKPLTAPLTPAIDDDFDDSWAEGSLGVRFGGTRRDSKNRSSSASAMSPSLASNLTMESEDDTMTGLILPAGPLDFSASLQRRQDAQLMDVPSSPSAFEVPVHLPPPAPEKKPLSGHEAEDDDFFADLELDSGDLLDPRKRKYHHNIKPTAKKFQKSSSVTPKTQASVTFSDKASTRIPRPVSFGNTRRLEPVLEVGASASASRPRRHEPTTTSAQLLRSKRSMPVMRSQPHILNKAPSVPALGNHHPLSRPLHFHTRRDSDGIRPHSPTTRTHSRLSSIGTTPDTPTRTRRDLAPAALAREAAAKRNLTRPAKRQHFGNGTELDSFDDLPTSATRESRYVKPASAKQPLKHMRSQASQSRLGMRDKSSTPQPPSTPFTSASQESLPRFARDTAASRIAREQTLSQPAKVRSEAPAAPRMNWAAQVAARSPYNSPQAKRTIRRMPNLINPMGKENTHHFQEDAVKKGMRWNSVSLRWEGNETALAGFGEPRQASPPRPALISNMAGNRQGVQVNGGMVFDPQRMCWLKMGASGSDALSASVDEEDDPFKDIEDLAETRSRADTGLEGSGLAGVGGDWLVGEEFDLGPEFIRRQREEESRWQGQVELWFADGGVDRQASLEELRAVATAFYLG